MTYVATAPVTRKGPGLRAKPGEREGSFELWRHPLPAMSLAVPLEAE